MEEIYDNWILDFKVNRLAKKAENGSLEEYTMEEGKTVDVGIIYDSSPNISYY